MTIIGALRAAKAGEKVRKTAPFYSAVDEALANLKRNKGTGAEFYSELKNTKNIKPIELADRKLEQAFKAKGKMTKEEAQQVLADNPPPNLKEKLYDESTAIDEDDLREMVSQEMFGVPYSTIGFSGARHRQISDEVYRRMDADNGTKYGKYRTPDGENYREILLKLPDDKQRFWAKNGQGVERIFNDPDEASRFAGSSGDARAMDSQTVDRMRNQYQSSHWQEDPNVLAHMRVQDRKGPNGEKILHVEEIQSDWHQEGRKKGYKPDDYIEQSNALDKQFNDLGERRTQLLKQAEAMPTHGAEFTSLMNEAIDITPKLMQLQEQRDKMRDVINYGVPDAPFKKNWHELAMKRLLNYAADNGYDSIAITPGAEQAKRFDLSKQINTISWNKQSNGLYGIEADTVEGRPIIKKGLTEQELEDTVGKEVANRIVNGVGQFANDPLFDSGKLTRGRLENLDLKVGGEGMMGFYDKMLPDYLNTYGKPYGAQVGTFDIPNPQPQKGISDLAGLLRQRGITDEQYANLPQQERIQLLNEVKDASANQRLPLHNFPITPEMRESIKQKGLPLYQQVGIPTAGAGAASQMLEPEEEPEYSKGGSIAKMAALAKLKQMRGEMAPRAEAIKNIIARDENRYLADVAPNSLTNAEIEAEIKRMAARAKASGQQEGVLPRAERDANLAKMLEQSEIQNRLYHGTTDDVPRFDPNMAGKKTGNLTTALGTFLSDNPAESSRYAELWGTEGGNVMPVFAQLKNPYVMPYSEYNKLAMGAWNRRMKDPDYDPNQIIKFGDVEAQNRASEALKKHEEAGLQDVIKRRNELIEQGHDSIVINIGGDREIIVFDPKKIKSATGNRGTYDINDPDVNKAKGGSVKPQVKKAVNGEVKITNNRDTMFMELSNKKLKRK